MESEKEYETARLLRESPSISSECSDSSIPTVVGSPSPDQFRYAFDLEPVYERDPSTEKPLSRSESTTPKPTRPPTSGRLSADAAVSSERPSQVPLMHAKTWMGDNSNTSHLEGDELKQPWKLRSKLSWVDSSQLLANEKSEAGLGLATWPTSSIDCPPTDRVEHGRTSWLSTATLFLATYSTVMSGLWFIVAILRPPWGHHISSRGISPSNATFACTLLAKSIELSSATAFVAFLGQKLSRRAYSDPRKGISLAEMSMRTWVFQPASIITHHKFVKCAAPSQLGLLTLGVAILAILYTSASETLGKFTLLSPRSVASAGLLLDGQAPDVLAERLLTVDSLS